MFRLVSRSCPYQARDRVIDRESQGGDPPNDRPPGDGLLFLDNDAVRVGLVVEPRIAVFGPTTARSLRWVGYLTLVGRFATCAPQSNPLK